MNSWFYILDKCLIVFFYCLLFTCYEFGIILVIGKIMLSLNCSIFYFYKVENISNMKIECCVGFNEKVLEKEV